MIAFIAKIWNDTTKNAATGEYSMKRLQAWGGYFFAMFLSFTNVVAMNLWPEQSFSVTASPDWLIYAWIVVGLGQTALTILGKIESIKASKIPPVTPETE